MRVRHVGIDEAGYGPNLGPLVMVAVAAERPYARADQPCGLDLWSELEGAISRAGGDPARLWVDDSKKIHAAKDGRERLTLGSLAAIESAYHRRPANPGELIQACVGAWPGELELDRWDSVEGRRLLARPFASADQRLELLEGRPLDPPGGRFRIVQVRALVLGPRRLNEALSRLDSKAAVHFEVFARLLRGIWQDDPPELTSVVSDLHGGRRYYHAPLSTAFPERLIERGEESSRRSCYRLRGADGVLELELRPRADAGDGLVALASMIAKTLREVWMDVFNAFWREQMPELKPTAGYPVDALRFRREIEPRAAALGLAADTWWRRK